MHRLLSAVILAGVGLAATASHAQSCGGAEGHTGVSASGLGASLLLTDNEARFRAQWTSPTPPSGMRGATLTTGQEITGVIVFKGCKAGADGRCNVHVEFGMLPQSGPPVDAGSGALWVSAPLPGLVMLGSASATVSFDATDKPGGYCLVARIEDKVANSVLHVRTLVTYRPMKSSGRRGEPAPLLAMARRASSQSRIVTPPVTFDR